jgi:hypothetical protein
MSIITLDGYIGSAKQKLTLMKTVSRTTVAAMPFSLFDIAGNPGAGVLAVGNTANGIVPTPAVVAGYPLLNTFGGGNLGYLSKVEFGNTVACRLVLYDRLFSCGAYSFNSNVSLASQPSYAGRLPNTDYKGLEIWVEQVTAATGNQAVAVTYTKEDGITTGRTTGAVGIGAAPTVGRMWQLPLQAGDLGVYKIESVVGTVATVGTFNVHVMRRLWSGRVVSVAAGDTHDLLKTGMVRVYVDSAIFLMVIADSTASGIPEMNIEIANG